MTNWPSDTAAKGDQTPPNAAPIAMDRNWHLLPVEEERSNRGMYWSGVMIAVGVGAFFALVFLAVESARLT